MTGEVVPMEEDAFSPKNRLKFPCSYGGRILPRPTDGQLKYVGGETRLLVVPRSVTFADLHARVTSAFPSADDAAVIKYQVMPEDLDALVSVRNDEDVLHMIDEYDRHQQLPRSPTSSPASRFRLYLFSAASRPPPLERSRSDAVRRPLLAMSISPGSSPPTGGGGMHRVRSSPNLGESQQGRMAAEGSPRYLLRHPPLHEYTAAFGVGHRRHGGLVGPWRAQAQLMSGGPRYEVCAYRCGQAISVQQAQQMESRCYYYPTPTPHVGPGRGGHVDEHGGMRSGLGYNFAPVPTDAKPGTD